MLDLTKTAVVLLLQMYGYLHVYTYLLKYLLYIFD